jgi:hypothetical protein
MLQAGEENFIVFGGMKASTVERLDYRKSLAVEFAVGQDGNVNRPFA